MAESLTTDDSTAKLQYDHSPVREKVVTLPERTSALVRGLDLVLDHHGASALIRGSLDVQVHKFLDTSLDETVWLKRAKYLLAYPLSKYLRNALPPAPDSVFKPSGALREWMRQRLTAFCRRNNHLWYSWLQTKRCALPASESIVEKTYSDHFTSLTRDDPGDPALIDEIFADETFNKVLSGLRDKITEEYRKSTDNGELFLDRSASNSACFETTRSGGGQHGELRMLSGFDSLYGTELSRMNWFAKIHTRGGLYANTTWEYRRPEGEHLWSVLHSRSKSITTNDPLSCTIQAVLEPMKVRVISKGEALPYYTMKPLQKMIHGAMRDMDCFRLIGRPLSPTDILDLKESAADTWKWFSIDYSAATDGLSWRYSGRILAKLIELLPPSQVALAMSVLGPHKLYYPTPRSEHECGLSQKVFKGVMRNGQLMGSILSFPILCLANLGVYLRVMSNEQRSWTYAQKLRHVLVNGDDMVYAGPESLYAEHARVSERVGLKMSVGKAYIHDEYLNINSTSVNCKIAPPSYPFVDKDVYPSISPNFVGSNGNELRQEWQKGSVTGRNTVTPWVIPYLNVGLFYGQHKVQGKSDSAEDHHAYSGGLLANLNVVLDGCLPGRQSDLLHRFLFVHKEAIQQESKLQVMKSHTTFFMTRNMFLPIAMGGMGINRPIGFNHVRVTQNDRFVARACVDKISARRSYLLPLPGMGVEKLKDMDEMPWSKPSSDDTDILRSFLVNQQDNVLCIDEFSTARLKITKKTLGPLKVQMTCYHWWPSAAFAA